MAKRPSSPQQKTPVGPPEELAGPPPKPKRCAAKTAKGKRCSRQALPDAKFCSQHIGPTTGRPTKLDPAVVDEIVSILRLGGYIETAAATAGVSKQTFYNWIERGDPEGTKKEDAPYREFREQVDRAKAEGEANNVALIQRAAGRDWKAAAWLLERQYPDRWAGPRGRGINSSIHPDDFAAGETSSGQQVIDDQVGQDGRPL